MGQFNKISYVTIPYHLCLNNGDFNFFTNNDDLQLIPEVVRYPHFEVPYPQLKRGQQSLGALVAVVRSFRYIYCCSDFFVEGFHIFKVFNSF